MKISELIAALQHVEQTHGDVPVQLQSDPNAKQGVITCYPVFFVVPEDYPDDGGWWASLRSWPH